MKNMSVCDKCAFRYCAAHHRASFCVLSDISQFRIFGQSLKTDVLLCDSEYVCVVQVLIAILVHCWWPEQTHLYHICVCVCVLVTYRFRRRISFSNQHAIQTLHASLLNNGIFYNAITISCVWCMQSQEQYTKTLIFFIAFAFICCA